MIPAPRDPSAVGFSRLGDLLPRTLREMQPVDNALGGKGGSKKPSLSQNANAVQKIQSALAFQEGNTILRSTVPVARNLAVDNPEVASERLAYQLATTLAGTDGLRHLAFYRKVARTVPRHVVLDALGRAKDARNIRKSRAHLFAYLVRPHLRQISFTHHPPQ